MGPRASLDILVKKKISCPSWESSPRQPSPQPRHCTDCATPAPKFYVLQVKVKISGMNHTQHHEEMWGNGGTAPFTQPWH